MNLSSLPRTGKTGRRLWHLLAGAFFPLLGLVVPRGVLVPLVVIACALGLSLELLRICHPAFNGLISHLIEIKPRETHSLSGAGYLLMATLIAFLLFPRLIAIGALLLVAVADPAAAIVGEHWGRHRFRGKSLEGGLAFLGAALLVGLALAPAGLPLGVAVVGALAGAAAESLPLPVDDNLLVPLLAGGAMLLVS